MTRGVVALVVLLARLTGLAIRKESLVWRRVDGDPDFARLSMDAIRMTAQLVLTAEAFGVVVACRTFEPEHLPGQCFGRLKRWRRGALEFGRSDDRILWDGLVAGLSGLRARRGACGRLLFRFCFRLCRGHWE